MKYPNVLPLGISYLQGFITTCTRPCTDNGFNVDLKCRGSKPIASFCYGIAILFHHFVVFQTDSFPFLLFLVSQNETSVPDGRLFPRRRGCSYTWRRPCLKSVAKIEGSFSDVRRVNTRYHNFRLVFPRLPVQMIYPRKLWKAWPGRLPSHNPLTKKKSSKKKSISRTLK